MSGEDTLGIVRGDGGGLSDIEAGILASRNNEAFGVFVGRRYVSQGVEVGLDLVGYGGLVGRGGCRGSLPRTNGAVPGDGENQVG
jgi:hypothetical protein